MAELLLELLSEEIPARMQPRAAEDLKRLAAAELEKVGLGFDTAETFVTPRRLVLVVDGLPTRQPDAREEKRGPRVGAPQQAIDGFLKANGLAKTDQLEQRDGEKGTFWYAVIARKGRSTAEVLPGVIAHVLSEVRWLKSMRWGAHKARWVRPLVQILAVFNWKPLEFADLADGDGLVAAVPITNRTIGHRAHAPRPVAVRNFADYREKLRERYVVLDAAERRSVIEKAATALARKAQLSLRDDPALLDEVAGLVEWPVVLMGTIDEAFMDVPQEVLITSMRTHQRYFSLLKKDGALAPRFILVANTETRDGGKAVVAGNERVLRARLHDAKFFWDQDRRRTLESRVPQLGDIVFHARLGTLADKVARLQALAAELAPLVPGARLDAVRSAATLAKADLTTGMVGEFPELQGVMGRYYALEEGESAAVADAIAEHYAPAGPSDKCPSAPVSVAVALADKIDTLVGFFAIGETPTGSRDPFALRRAAIGVIRLIVENRLRVPLAKAIGWARVAYAGRIEGFAAEADKLEQELLEFFADRLKVHLRETGVRHDLISAVFAVRRDDDLVRLLARVDALRAFLGSEDGANLLTAHKRATNIVAIEERKDATTYEGAADAKSMVAGEETALHTRLGKARGAAEDRLAKEDFAGAMRALADLRGPVDAFFDKVTVNAEQRVLRENRLRLLAQIRATMNVVADFSRIEG